jgi:hypothetical protein
MISKAREAQRTDKTVSNSTNLLESFLLQVFNGSFDDSIDLSGGMWVIATSSLREPGHEIESLWNVQAKCISVEEIGDDGVVSIGCILISHQLGVLPCCVCQLGFFPLVAGFQERTYRYQEHLADRE